MNIMILALVLVLNTFTFAYKLSNDEGSIETVHNGDDSEEKVDYEDLEAYRQLLTRKLTILTNYMKSHHDIQEKRGHIWKRNAQAERAVLTEKN